MPSLRFPMPRIPRPRRWAIRSLQTGVACGLTLLLARSAAAQIDYRNLDDDRPTVVEDAYPIERYAFEFLVPYRFEREPGSAQLHLFTPELEYGVLRNAQLGLKFPIAGAREAGGPALAPSTDWGLAGISVFGLYNFFSEGPWLPALSLRTDVSLPVGSLAGDETQVTFKGIATRSWGQSRVHVNVAWTPGSTAQVAAAEPAARWTYGLAVDRTLFRQSILLIGEVYGLQATKESRTEFNTSLGARYQFNTTTVLDIGVTRRLRSDIGPDFAITAGFSHAFAVPWLMPRLR